MRKLKWGVAIAVVLLALYLLLWPVPIDPVAWDPSPDPGLAGPYVSNDALARVQRIEVGVGPEDVVRGPDGLLYTGLDDGRIVRFDPSAPGSVETFVDTGGRPLGLAFDATGNLIVADAFRGLLSVSADGTVRVLADSVDGRRMLFPNDLDIAADGTIWLSDASQRFGQRQFMLDFLEGRPTGRLLTYDPDSGQLRVRLQGLGFANGVALGPDDRYVLVDETMFARISRLWLTGPRAGEHDVFVDSLPGHPDNLSYNGSGVFWVALAAPRAAALERLAPHPLLRKILARVPGATRIPGQPYGWVVALDTAGNVVGNLQDPTGSYAPVTSVHEIDGDLYLGSIGMSSVGRLSPGQ